MRTPEQLKADRKADAAWEKSLYRKYDLAAVRAFLVATIANQKKKDDVDLTVSRIGDQWRVSRHQRMLFSGDWSFVPDEKGDGFQLRYDYGKEYEIVFVCVRKKKDSFRLVEVRSEQAKLELSGYKQPNQALLPTTLSVTPRACARVAPDSVAADL